MANNEKKLCIVKFVYIVTNEFYLLGVLLIFDAILIENLQFPNQLIHQ